MSNFSKTQIAALATATEMTVEVMGRDENGRLDYSAPVSTVTGMVIKGHRNGVQGLIRAGYATGGLKGLGDNHALLTDKGIAAL